MAIVQYKNLAFNWDGLRLAGSLHLPAGERPHPAVVLAQGSGPADRDSGGYFGPIRRAFIDRGIATFAFDKPGCGESSGDWRNFALNGRAEQLVAALDLVRNHPDIAGDRVGVWGHSQGGWLVQKLAGSDGGLAFAVASSAPSLSVGEQVLYECEQTLRSAHYDEPAMQEALGLAEALQYAAVTGVDFDEVTTNLLKPASLRPWYSSFPPLDDADDWHHLGQLLNEPHAPLSDLSAVRCPFLAVYGGLDVLLPAWQGAEASGRALAATERTDATVVVFPNADHRMQNPPGSEFVNGYLDLLGDWTATHAHQ